MRKAPLVLPLRRTLTTAAVVACLLPAGCRAADPDDDASDGFRSTVASYVESSSNGSTRYVGFFENTAGPVESAQFEVRFLDRGEVVWTGRGSAQEIAAGETVQVEMTGPTPVPTGAYDVEFEADAVRPDG